MSNPLGSRITLSGSNCFIASNANDDVTPNTALVVQAYIGLTKFATLNWVPANSRYEATFSANSLAALNLGGNQTMTITATDQAGNVGTSDTQDVFVASGSTTYGNHNIGVATGAPSLFWSSRNSSAGAMDVILRRFHDDLGLTFVRVDAFPGAASTDNIVRSANRVGLKVVLCYVTADTSTGGATNWVNACFNQWRGLFHAMELGNEIGTQGNNAPNFSTNPAGYAPVLAAGYRAAKLQDATLPFLMGSVTSGTSTGQPSQQWMQQLLTACQSNFVNGKWPFDGYCLHPYYGIHAPFGDPSVDHGRSMTSNSGGITGIRNMDAVFQQFPGAPRTQWVTEFGYGWPQASGQGWPCSQQSATFQTIQDYTDRLLTTWQQESYTGPFMWFCASGNNLCCGGPGQPTCEETSLGLLDPSTGSTFIAGPNTNADISNYALGKRPSYDAIKRHTTAPPDSTPPVVGWSSPTDGTTVGVYGANGAAVVNLAATGSDPESLITSTNFNIGGPNYLANPAGVSFGPGAYVYSWETTGLTDGDYSLSFAATSQGGTGITRTITLHLKNTQSGPTDTTPPVVSFAQPTAGATVAGTVTLGGTAADPESGVAQAWFTISGIPGTIPATLVTGDDFSMSAAPAAVSKPQNGGEVDAFILPQVTAGNPQSLTLSVTGVPNGVTATFDQPTIQTNGSTVLRITVGNVTVGTYTLVVTAAAVSGTHSANVALTVTAQVNDFSLSASPSGLSQPQNGGVASAYVISSIVSGTTENITLSCTGAPAGVTTAFTVNPIQNNAASLLQVTVGNAALGTYNLQVTGTGSARSHTITVPVTVTASGGGSLPNNIVSQFIGVPAKSTTFPWPSPAPPLTNQTCTIGAEGIYDAGHCDLGVCWDDGAGHVLFAFGDTCSDNGWTGAGTAGATGYGVSNWIARSSDTNLMDGTVTIDFVPTGGFGVPPGFVKQVLPRTPPNNPLISSSREITILPSGGFSIGSRQFMGFTSQPNGNTANYFGIAYSDDGGSSFLKSGIDGSGDAYWPNTGGTDPFQYNSFTRADANGHGGATGYVYMLGTPSYRVGLARLARCLDANVLTKSAWQYWNGSGWVSNEGAAVPLWPADSVSGSVGESGLWWSSTLNKWFCCYTDGNPTFRGLVFRSAPALTGPWSATSDVATAPFFQGVYGGFIHPWSSGTDMFVMMSIWDPYTVYLFHRTVS